LEAELEKYRQIVRDLRASGESMLVKTQRQKVYHKRILDLQNQLEKLK